MMGANKSQIRQRSIKALYTLALTEEEGIGTAYEYFVKRLYLMPWLGATKQIKNVLVAGLPEKYGVSLDFMLLASELEASLTIVDERPAALDKAREALGAAQQINQLGNLRPQLLLVDDGGSLDEISDSFDLALASETLQRHQPERRSDYFGRLLELAPHIALFAPNEDNPGHTRQSGLSGIRLIDLERLVTQSRDLPASADHSLSLRAGYLDMPPFPPGVTRSAAQRERATSGKGEAFAMWGLAYYARMEHLLPLKWRRRNAHIVYAFIKQSPR